MKRPNKLLNKKYLSSLVIAAFLILSVLTAYNIRFGEEKAETEVEETIGDNEDVISSGEARIGSREQSDGADDTDDAEGTESGRNEEDGADDADETAGDRGLTNDTSEKDDSRTSQTHFAYDGKHKEIEISGSNDYPYNFKEFLELLKLDQYFDIVL